MRSGRIQEQPADRQSTSDVLLNNQSGIANVRTLLNSLSISSIVISLLILPIEYALSPASSLSYWMISGLIGWSLITQWIMRRCRPRFAAIFFLLGMYGVLTLFIAVSGGLRSSTFSLLTINVLFAGLMLGRTSALFYLALSVLTTLAFFIVERMGYLPHPIEQRPHDFVLAHLGVVSVGTAFSLYALKHINQGLTQLRRSEEQFRKMFELAPIGMATLSLHGRFEQINDSFCTALGYAQPEMLQLSFRDITHPDDLVRNEQLFEKIATGVQDSVGCEKRYVRRDGSIREASLQLSLIRDGRGQPYQCLAQIVDLTSTKRAEAAILQTQKLESLGVLAGGIAHDFNNLLTSILAQASILAGTLPEKSPAAGSAEQITLAAERAAALTQQMLTYSGHKQIQFSAVNINELIRKNLHLLRAALSKAIDFEHRLTARKPYVNGDEVQLQQILMNLIINAVEAISDHPMGLANHNSNRMISVKTSAIVIEDQEIDRFPGAADSLPAGDYLVITVSDNGPGMTMEMKSRVFDPFFTTKPYGSGLGLASVLGIVRAHQGGVYLQTEIDRGTTFQILLPTTSPPQDESEATPQVEPVNSLSSQASSTAVLDGCIVLVIDDDVSIRETLCSILDAFGAQTLTAHDGRSGIALFQQHIAEIDMIILDLSMPGISGEETFLEIRTLSDTVPILISSGFSKSDSAESLELDRYSSFLQKPYRYDELTNIVAHHLNQSKGSSRADASNNLQQQ